MKLKLDLHDIYSSGDRLECSVRDIMEQAWQKRADEVEIIPGKGSGQLKKWVLRFLEKEYKGRYSRINKDSKNFGRIFVLFNWNKLK